MYRHVTARNGRSSRDKPRRVYDAIWYARLESAGALLMSFFVNLAVVAVNADNFYTPTCAELDKGPYACMSHLAFVESGQDNVTDGSGTPCTLPRSGEAGYCGDFGLQSEGFALKYALGDYTIYVWAIGLCAAGQASTMVCTYAGQIIMGGCLELKLSPWMRVALTRVFALGPALTIAAATYGNQKLFNTINEYLNVLQSVQLPFAMLPVLHFAAQNDLLGRFRSSGLLSIVSSCIAVGVMSVNVLLIYQFITDPDNGIDKVGPIVAVLIYGVGYFYVCLCMVWDELVAILSFLRGFIFGLSRRGRVEASDLAQALTNDGK